MDIGKPLIEAFNATDLPQDRNMHIPHCKSKPYHNQDSLSEKPVYCEMKFICCCCTFRKLPGFHRGQLGASWERQDSGQGMRPRDTFHLHLRLWLLWINGVLLLSERNWPLLSQSCLSRQMAKLMSFLLLGLEFTKKEQRVQSFPYYGFIP